MGLLVKQETLVAPTAMGVMSVALRLAQRAATIISTAARRSIQFVTWPKKRAETKTVSRQV